jgi:HTH-type transcriptional regulator/antitoxin HipB
MNYPIFTPIQLRAILRALRRSRSLTQAQLGILLGVNQRRIARIEKNPNVASIGQISRFVSALGGRLVVEFSEPKRLATSKPTKTGRTKKAHPTSVAKDGGIW